jgi:hypothetical protein
MDVVTSWMYLYLPFILPPLLLLSLILKDRMSPFSAIERHNGLDEGVQRRHGRPTSDRWMDS